MQIYISHEREEVLRVYAKTMNRSISSLIGEFIDDLGKAYKQEVELQELLPVRAEDELKPMCERPFCKQRSEGRYRIVTDGVDEVTQNLCVFHWNGARKEGEVHAT